MIPNALLLQGLSPLFYLYLQMNDNYSDTYENTDSYEYQQGTAGPSWNEDEFYYSSEDYLLAEYGG